MLWTPKNAFTQYQNNANLPITSAGTVVVPGANDAKGSWVDLLAGTVTSDSYGIFIHLQGNSSSAAARPTLLDIGQDPAGGTAYTVLIPNLNASSVAAFSATGFFIRGFKYFFPLFIKAGTRLAARAQVGNASAGDLNCIIRLYQRPTEPHLCAFGTYVDAIGIDLANSRGTAITPAVQPTEGTWTAIGTLPRDAWWFQQSFSIDNAVMTSQDYYADLGIGDGTSMRVLIENQVFQAESAETMTCTLASGPECVCPSPSGTSVRMRVCGNGTADSGTTGMVYALG